MSRIEHGPTPHLRAPQYRPVPLPIGSDSPLVARRNDTDRRTDISYPSVSSGERQVFNTKFERYQQWTDGVTRDGGLHKPESQTGRAVGAGSAIWSERGINPAADEATSFSRSAQNPGFHHKGDKPNKPKQIGIPTPTASLLAVATSSTQRRRSPQGSPQSKIALPALGRPAPTPYLAAPPARATANRTPLAPGDQLFPYSAGSTSRAQRDAYLASALSLPLDMLREDIDGRRVPSPASSVLTGGRLASLLSQRRSPSASRETLNVSDHKRQSDSHPAPVKLSPAIKTQRGAKPHLETADQLPPPQSFQPDEVNHLAVPPSARNMAIRSISSAASQRSRDQLNQGDTELHTPSDSSRERRGAHNESRIFQRSKRSNSQGTLPGTHLQPSRRDERSAMTAVPHAVRSGPERSDRQVGSSEPASLGRTSGGRNLANPSHLVAHHDEPSELPYTQPPAPTATVASNSHRQHLALPRPALSRQGSPTDRSQGHLGRNHSGPSLTNLTARFPPEMYPLPASHSDSGTMHHSPSTQNRMPPTSPYNRQKHPQTSKGGRNTDDDVKTHRAVPSVAVVNTMAEPNLSLITPAAQVTHPASRLSHDADISAMPIREHQLPDPAVRHRQLPVETPSVVLDNSTFVLPAAPSADLTARDPEHLSFEVPSGDRGRLRVSLAWFRDGGRSERRARTNAGQVPSEISAVSTPPPVPPKHPPSRFAAEREEDHIPRTSRSTPAQPYHDRPGQEIHPSSPGPELRPRERPRGQLLPLYIPERGSPSVDGPEVNVHSLTPYGTPTSPYWPSGHSAHFGPHPNQLNPFAAQYPTLRFAYPQPSVPNGSYNAWHGTTVPGYGIGHPQPALAFHHANPSAQSRAVPSLAPPSPRPRSIDPPSSRGSPSADHAELHETSAYGNRPGYLTASGFPNTPFVRPSWALPPPRQSRISRFFGRNHRDASQQCDEEATVGPRLKDWRSRVTPGRAPTGGQTHRIDNYDRGWQNRRKKGGFSGIFGRPWNEGPRGHDPAPRLAPAPLPPHSIGARMGVRRGVSPSGHPRAPREGVHWFGQHIAERQRMKAERRLEKAERRNRREARSQESLPRRDRSRPPHATGLGGFGMGSMFGMRVPRKGLQDGRNREVNMRSADAPRLGPAIRPQLRPKGGTSTAETRSRGLANWMRTVSPKFVLPQPARPSRDPQFPNPRGQKRNRPARDEIKYRPARRDAQAQGLAGKLSTKKWSQRNQTKRPR